MTFDKITLQEILELNWKTISAEEFKALKENPLVECAEIIAQSGMDENEYIIGLRTTDGYEINMDMKI